MNDPSTGPLDRETLKELAAAPFGEAAAVIRKYDPQWGRGLGEKFDWKVTVRRSGADRGTAIIKAANQEEADALADDLTEMEIDWDYDSDGFEVETVEPAKVGK
jgi:hypothetical protein